MPPFDVETETFLKNEVNYFHRRCFGPKLALEPATVERYVRAHRELPLETGLERDVDCRAIVARGLDPFAIEFYLRRRTPKNRLTRKVHVFAYLLEASVEHRRLLLGEAGGSASGSAWRAFAQLGWAALKSVYLYGKGSWLVRVNNV